MTEKAFFPMSDANQDDDIFEEGPASDANGDAFDDGEGVVILSAENRDSLLEPTSRLFKFPAEEGKPRTGFYVRHATLARVNRYQNAHKAGNASQQLKALCELIADSVVDNVDQPVWNAGQVRSMSHSRVDWFMHMQKCVSLHNGMSDQSAKMEEIIEEAEKNS